MGQINTRVDCLLKDISEHDGLKTVEEIGESLDIEERREVCERLVGKISYIYEGVRGPLFGAVMASRKIHYYEEVLDYLNSCKPYDLSLSFVSPRDVRLAAF